MLSFNKRISTRKSFRRNLFKKLSSTRKQTHQKQCRTNQKEKTRRKGGQIWGKRSTPEELKQHVYLTYGLISDGGIDMFLNDISLTKRDVFYDLGSGVGNVCDRVFKTTPVRKCVGIEYDRVRYNESLQLSKQNTTRQMKFIHGNFMYQDWSDATVLFMDSIMFTFETLQKIEHKARTTCPNLRYVISMKKLPSNSSFKYLKTEKVNVSWGSSEYNLYQV